MATIGLELVDAAVTAVRDGVRVASSPGIALLDPAGLLVGEAAAAAARLKPVLAADRFWSDLAVDSMVQTGAPAVSHADLAHAHLAQLWNTVGRPGDEVVLAIPGAMRLHEAGLVLGIAGSLSMPVAGLVDAAVAACAGLAARATVLHLDIQFHQAVLTDMQGANVLRRRRFEIAPRAGLKAIHAAWAHLISEAMVRRTRFDPLHQAASEQQLYQRLPDWLGALASQDAVDVSIETDTGSFSASLRREQFVLAAEAWYAQLIELVAAGQRSREPVTLALSARAAGLPALRERLASSRDLELVVLPDTAPAAAAAARAAEIGPGDPPTLVTALSRAHPVPAAAGHSLHQRGAGFPTHVIFEGRAHPIDERPLVLGLGTGEGRHLALTGPPAGISRAHCTLERRDGRVIVRDHSRYGTFVNGERVDGDTALAAGDRLRLGTPGVVLELVAVG